MSERDDRRLHDTLDFIGLRAHATAAAVVQLCTELHRAGVLDEGAMDRIKNSIAKEIALSRPRAVYSDEYARARDRLDEVFAGREPLPKAPDVAA